MFTSKELSQKLTDNGFRAEHNKGVVQRYDILNDICVKYAEEFFYADNNLIIGNITTNIFNRIRVGDSQKEVEDYLWKYCKFNPLNK